MIVYDKNVGKTISGKRRMMQKNIAGRN